MRAKDACRKVPVTVTPERSVGEVARLMDETAVGAVVVVDGDRPVGIVTDRDLTVRVLARGLPIDARVDAVMTADPVTIDGDADLREAADTLAHHPFRRLPVIEGGRMVGMLSTDDLVVDAVWELAELVRPVTGQVIFGHRDVAAAVPAVRD